MFELKQDNVKKELKRWFDFEMPVITGAMSECISLVFLGRNGFHYGIHCGGGLSVDEANSLFEQLPSSFIIDQTFVIFGWCYRERFSCLFSSNDVYDIFGDNTIILCSDNAEITSSVLYKANYIWNREANKWDEYIAIHKF